MSRRPTTRLKSKPGPACAGAIVVCLAALGAISSLAQNSSQPPPPANTVVLDRVVAVVNNQAILASDLDEEVRLSVLDPERTGLGVLTRQRAMEQLVSRALIQQQIREEDAQVGEAGAFDYSAGSHIQAGYDAFG